MSSCPHVRLSFSSSHPQLEEDFVKANPEWVKELEIMVTSKASLFYVGRVWLARFGWPGMVGQVWLAWFGWPGRSSASTRACQCGCASTRSARPGWCGGVGQRAWRPARWAAGCVGAETPTLLPKAASCQAVLKSPLGFSACGRVRVVTSAALLPQPGAQVKAEIQALSSFGFQYLSHQVRRGARAWLHSRCGRSRGLQRAASVGGWLGRKGARPASGPAPQPCCSA